MIRTILSPGVELQEVDKSQYTPTTVDTFRVLLPGFSSKGKINQPTTVTSMAQFRNDFGVPTNEAERYAFNAANIILNDGGEVVFARLPYKTAEKFPCITYSVGESATIVSSDPLNKLTDTDPTITSASTIKFDEASMLSLSAYTELGSTGTELAQNEFKIVDITRSEYLPYTSEGKKVNCLGIMPVITTAPNAMAIASQINGVNMIDPDDTATINVYESLTGIQYFNDNTTGVVTNQDTNWLIPAKTATNNATQSISKNAAEFFPAISYYAGADETNNTVYDKTYFSYIGVVVYQISVDAATGCLQAIPVEAYAGSLIKDAVDIRTNASTYIENIVNTQSSRIRIYAKIDETKIQDSILYTTPAVGTILGNAPLENSAKKLKYSDITASLDTIFNSQSNILATTVDVVCDAGISTIGQYVHVKESSSQDDQAEFNPDETAITSFSENTAQWRGIVDKMKGFCQNTRKDCVFITESPRHFSLNGRNKIVDGIDSTKTVANNITPKIKYISGINSSYGWGYAVWYKIADIHSGKLFWMPASAFGTGVYVRTRRLTNAWSAPAGINRGVISVADTSFEPDLQARNALYTNAWNYSLTYTNQGTVLEGQKTFQTKPSALDRINVRSLNLYLERKVFNTARLYIYEPNTTYTRQQFIDDIAPVFESVKSAGGLYDYRIIYSDELNTPEIIDQGAFIVRIGIKATKTMEWIGIEFVNLRTGSTFRELEEG